MKRDFVPKKTKGNLFPLILHTQKRRGGFLLPDCSPKIQYFWPKQLQTRFSGSFPDAGGRQRSHKPFVQSFGKTLAIVGHFSAKTEFFFGAGGLATPDMLLQYNCKHVSVGPSPTPAVVKDPTKRSGIQIQGTTNGNENKGQSQQAAPL